MRYSIRGYVNPIGQRSWKVVELTGSSSRLIYEPLPSDDPAQRQPNIALARERLGWEPGIDLEAGLK